MTNSLLIAIYRLFPPPQKPEASTLFLIFSSLFIPLPPFVVNLSLLHNGALHWCGVVVRRWWKWDGTSSPRSEDSNEREDREELIAAIRSSISKGGRKKKKKSLTIFLNPQPLLSCSFPLCPLSPTSPLHPSLLYTTPPLFHALLSLLSLAHLSTPLVSPGGSCQSRASPTIPLELIVPAVAGGGRRCEAAESRRWRERCQSLSLIINFCHSGPRGSYVAGASHSLCLSLLPFSTLLLSTHSARRSASLCPSYVQSPSTSLVPH